MLLKLEVQDDLHEVCVEQLPRVLLLLLKLNLFISSQLGWSQGHD